jgi:hypothetical protein
MNDNKLISGGLIFAFTSLVTYGYHAMNDTSKYKRKYTPMKPIIEEYDNNDNDNDNGTITPSNTPELRPENNSISSIDTKDLLTYQEDSSPLKIDEEDDDIEKIINTIEKKIDNHTNTLSISSFLELCNTGSQTDTEELEFTKLNNKFSNISITRFDDKKYHSDCNYESDNSEKSDIEISYFSETELYKPRKKKRFSKKFLNF